MAYYDIYPTLWSQASGNLKGIQTKFPFLCDLEPMIQAISESNILTDNRRNPNGYDKYEMAEAAIGYIDKFCDYTTGKAPRALEQPYEDGWIMSQPQYWNNMNFGMYWVGEDPGWGIGDVAGGYGAHYLTAPSSINETVPTGTYHSNPLRFNLTTTLATSSFAEYVDSGYDGQPYLDTANTGITSDDIVGVSYQLEGLKGIDVDGNELALDEWHYPLGYGGSILSPGGGLPGITNISIGSRSNQLTSTEIYSNISVSDSEVQQQATLYNYSGTPTLREYGTPGSTYVAPFVHFAADAGFSNKVNNLSGDAGDVAPQYKFVAPPYDGSFEHTQWERTRDTYVVFDIFSMVDTGGNTIPATATLEYIWDPNSGSPIGSYVAAGTDVDLTPYSGDHWLPVIGNSGELTFYINPVTNELETKFRSSQSMDISGIPVYSIWIRYTDAGQTYDSQFYIPFHYLSQWTIDTHIGYSGAQMAVSLANGDTAGITGDCYADYVDVTGATITATAKQGPFEIESVSIENQGRGYTYDQEVTAEFPTPVGRHYQGLLFTHTALNERSNNNPLTIVQLQFYDDKNDYYTYRARPGATFMLLPVLDFPGNADYRVARPVYTYTHGSYYMGTQIEHYKIRGFLGTDYQYQKDNWARRYSLNGSGLIDGLSFAGLTHTDTIGIDEAPGLEYGPNAYHADQNPHGDDTQYVSNTWGSGIDDERWYAKSKGVFDITITDGRVTAVVPRSRDDGNGVACQGGWGYSTSNITYTELALFEDTPLPGDAIMPVINVRNDTAADNGYGNKVTFNINDTNNGFYPGKNLPDGQYTYAFSFGVNNGYANGVSDNFDTPNWYNRNWQPRIDPSSVRIGVERPTLISTTRSLKTIAVGTGAHRYTFELEYPPMTQDEAAEVINLFDKLRGPTQAIQLVLPRTAIRNIEGWAWYNKPGMAENLVISGGTSIGDTEITLNGFEANQSPSIPVGTLFTGLSPTKIYQVVDSTNADEFGRAKIKFEPPLVATLGSTIRGKAGNQLRADYVFLKAFIVDDKIDYTIDAAGHYRLTAIKFREALVGEV
jgi:hypothetical protein